MQKKLKIKASLIMILCLCIIFTSVFLSPKEVSADTPSCDITRVFTYGEGSYQIFHQSGMVVAKSGTILAYTQGRLGSSNDSAPADIIMKRSTDNGATWGAMQVVWDHSETSEKWGNPTFVADTYDGKIYSFVEIPAGKELWYKISTDNGATWSSAVQINPNVFSSSGRNANGNSPSNGICTSSGRIMIPIECRNATETASGYTEKDFLLGVLYSDDHGNTWQMSSFTSSGNNQGCEFSVAQAPNGTLYMNARPVAGDTRVFAVSTDDGSTWSSMALISDLNMFKTASGTTADSEYMYFASPEMTSTRKDGYVWYSADNGANWIKGPLLYEGGFGNTSMGMLNNSTTGCLFQSEFRTNYTQYHVDFASFTSDWVTAAISDTTKIVNDDIGIIYSGSWGDSNNQSGCYNGDNHASKTPSSYVKFTFTGTSIAWYGSKAADHGKADIYIDDVLQATVDTYYSGVPSLKQQELYAKSGLTDSLHTIKIVLRNDKNSSSSNYYQDVDFFTYTKAPVNDNDGGIVYTGTWGYSSNANGCYHTDNHHSNTAASEVQYSFTGTGVTWYGSMAADHGKADIYIDNVLQTTVDTYYSGTPSIKQQALYTKTGLPKGLHTIRIVLRDDKNAASSDYYQDVDAFRVY